MRNPEGDLVPASWPEALQIAAQGLLASRGRAGVLTGGRLTIEDAYAYSKFARVALDTNDIDFRARVHSGEEADFLAARVAGRGRDLDGTGVTYSLLEKAPAVLLAGFEAEEEAPGIFLRLRKAWRKHGQKVFSLATHETRGLEKAGGTLLPAAPGTETEWLDALASGVGLEDDGARASEALRTEGAVIVVGERLAGVAGGLTAAVRAASATGAHLVWIPRRAGERGAVEAGALPSLLPGGRPATDPRAREEVATAWGVAELPHRYGRDTGQIVEAAATGELQALVVAGVEVADLPDPARAREALAEAGFLVSLELRPSEVTELADVVLPVAAVAEKAGTFLNWEGRVRFFEAALKPDHMTRRLPRPTPASCRCWPTPWTYTWVCRICVPRVRSWTGWGPGTGPGPPNLWSPRPSCRGLPPERPCWPDIGCCSTRAGSRTATRRSPGRGTPPTRACRPPRPPKRA